MSYRISFLEGSLVSEVEIEFEVLQLSGVQRLEYYLKFFERRILACIEGDRFNVVILPDGKRKLRCKERLLISCLGVRKYRKQDDLWMY